MRRPCGGFLTATAIEWPRCCIAIWQCGRLDEALAMTQADYERKVDEVDRLLNDPDVPMEPARIWLLLAEIAQYDRDDAAL